MVDPGGDDLSADPISKAERIDLRGKIAEERERRWWKTRLLWVTAMLILAFYGALIGFIFSTPRGLVSHTHVLFAAILAAIPTLLSINFFKLVRSKDQPDKDDLESNPWFSLLKELVAALKK